MYDLFNQIMLPMVCKGYAAANIFTDRVVASMLKKTAASGCKTTCGSLLRNLIFYFFATLAVWFLSL